MAIGPTNVNANTDIILALTRDGATGQTKVYLNDTLQETYTGAASTAAIPTGNLLTFFRGRRHDGRLAKPWAARSITSPFSMAC